MAKQTAQPKHPYIPREDLKDDLAHWKSVLWNCWNIDQEMYGLLHGIRCGGGQLALTQNSFRLLPGNWSEAEWYDVKQSLEPYRDKLVEVFRLARFGEVTKEKLPKGIFEEAKP